MSMKTTFLAPRFWPIWLILGLLRLIVLLPIKWQLQIGRSLGQFLSYLPTKMRSTTEVNLALCFPELSVAERTALLRKNFESVGMGAIETALGWWAPNAKLSHLAHITGAEHLAAALKKGKGVIFCSAHFTTLEVIGRLFALQFPIAVMYRPQKNALVEEITRKSLQKHYLKVIAREDIRGMLRCLKQNIPIFYTPDVDAGAINSVFVPFFGISAASITATSRYAKMSGASVIPSFFYRRADNSGYDIVLQPAIADFPSENLEQDITRINQIIETAIRRCPEQYLWQYKRFKTRPNDEKRFY